MPRTTFHVLHARGELGSCGSWVSERLTEAYARASAIRDPGALDVIVQASARVVPEKGHFGYTPAAGRIFVSVDPNNPALRANPAASLERMFVHELHHSIRWDGPGFGRTLGEALVSEGLAGHFAAQVYPGPPEPWEALPRSVLAPFLSEAAGAWDNAEYGHADWFFGTGGRPNWLGYSLGYRLVSRHLDANEGETAASLAHAPADPFRGALSHCLKP